MRRKNRRRAFSKRVTVDFAYRIVGFDCQHGGKGHVHKRAGRRAQKDNGFAGRKGVQKMRHYAQGIRQHDDSPLSQAIIDVLEYKPLNTYSQESHQEIHCCNVPVAKIQSFFHIVDQERLTVCTSDAAHVSCARTQVAHVLFVALTLPPMQRRCKTPHNRAVERANSAQGWTAPKWDAATALDSIELPWPAWLSR
jgi:hypothetical protein